MPWTINYIFVLIGTFLIAIVTTPLVRSLALRVGAVDNPNARRINKKPMPSAGGLAILSAFVLATLVFMPMIIHKDIWHVSYIRYILPVVVGGSVVALTGFIDDILELKPLPKMLGIVIGAVIVWAFTDFRFDSFKIPFGGPMIHFGPVLTLILTVLWIAAITNAINLIDGLDGLVGGVSIISLMTMGVISYFFLYDTDIFLTMTIFVLVAAIMGFFPYNYHPAIIYLGDTGALFIGCMIGVLSLQGLKNATAVAILSPVIILGVPIVDTVVAIVRRKLSGRPAMEADKMHLHHRLLAMGFTHRGAVLVVYAIAILFSLIALLLNVSSRFGGILLLLSLILGMEILIEGLEIWGVGRTPLFNFRSEIGVLFLNSYNRDVLTKMFDDNRLTYTSLFKARPHIFVSKSNPLAKHEVVSLEDLEDFPYLSYDQGIHNSFYYSEEILSQIPHKKSIVVSDRATLFNLLIGLDGYTIATGILNSNLNGDNIVSIPLDIDDEIDIVYLKHEKATLSKMGEKFLDNLVKEVTFDN